MTDAIAVDDDLGDEGMQCSKHPYRNNNASNGGICPLCLQEKLGKLVSSSLFNLGSSSPSFRSDPSATANAASLSLTLALRPAIATSLVPPTNQTKRSRIPFLKRSKSAVAPRKSAVYSNANHKRGRFWSFFHHSKPKPDKPSATPAAVVVEESVDSPSSGSSNATSFGRKVSRSRSVGCGSRSFSGDFFERISTGFGDCTLRRVESQREEKRRSSGDVIKEKVRCGGIFSGFMMTSSSSSSSDRLSSGDEHGKAPPVALHGRSKSWRWALASPMRAFGKPSPSPSKMAPPGSKSNVTPNLSAIPSLITVR